MKHLKMSVDKAYEYVKNRRPEISPNLGFMGQLYEYQSKLHGCSKTKYEVVDHKIQTPEIITPVVQTTLTDLPGNTEISRTMIKI